MGVMQHHAIIATTWDDEAIVDFNIWLQDGVIERLRSLFLVGNGLANSYRAVVMIPDGSKEGWETSGEGDLIREKFIAFLNLSPKGYSPWKWVEVSFGESGQRITQGNNE